MSTVVSSARQNIGAHQQKTFHSFITHDSPKRSHTWKYGARSVKSNKEQLGTPSYPSPLDRIHTKRFQQESAEEFKCKLNDTSSRLLNNASNKEDTGVLNKLKGDGLNSFSYTCACSKGAFPCSDDSRSLSSSWVLYNYVGGSQPNISFTTCMQNPNKAVLTINNRTTEIMVANKIACQLLGLNVNKLGGERLCEYLKFGSGHAMIETQLESTGEIIVVSGKVMEMINSNGESTTVSVWMKKLPSINEPRCLVVMEPVERTTAKFYINSSGKILSCDETMSVLYAYQCPKELEGINITQLISSISLPLQGCDSIMKQQATGRTRHGTNFPLTIMFKPFHGHCSDFIPELVDGEFIYQGIIWVFANISGMITVFRNGTIHSCNTNFSQMLFGLSQEDLIGKSITTLIPTFYDDLEFLDTDSIPLPPLDDDDDDDDDDNNIQLHCLSDGRVTADSTMESRPSNPLGKQVELMIESSAEAFTYLTLDSSCSPSPNQKSSTKPPAENIEWLQSKVHSDDNYCEGRLQGSDKISCPPCHIQKGPPQSDINENTADELLLDQANTSSVNHKSVCCNNVIKQHEHSYIVNFEHLSNNIQVESISNTSSSPNLQVSVETAKEKADLGVTSTPKEKMTHFENNHFSNESLQSFPEGSYFGLGRHKDGCELEISYQIRHIELDDGQIMYCLWVTRDAESGEANGSRNNILVSSIHSSADLKMESTLSQEKCNNEDCSNVDISDSVYTSGEYCHNYTVLQQIGKGAFGCVKMAFCNTDKLLVITKFIQKSKVYPECWAYNSKLEKNVPLEISLLASLKHPNIVQVLQVFENDDYFQMVMEKHGSGMDLFEFIDRGPNLDEPLASYIFRQIVSALTYLHNLNVLHRDVKDENIILNHSFHVKLIDFGSATFMQDGHSFSTFCGTMEYCSPEVLQGNQYNGPELEMWALGVTLYTLVFGENPFFDVDETIEAILKPPFQVSHQLMLLISSLLHPDPIQRCSLSSAADHSWTNQPVDLQNYRFDEVIICSPEESNPSKYYLEKTILPKQDASNDYVLPTSDLAV